MSKKKLKKEIKRLNKIVDVLLKESRGVCPNKSESPLDKEVMAYQVLSDSLSTTTTNDYLGGRPKDR